MKSSFLLILFSVSYLFLLSSGLICQSKDTSESKLHHFNIYFINGYAVSYDYYRSDDFSLWANLDFSSRYFDNDLENNRNSLSNNDTSVYLQNSKSISSNSSISLSSHIILPVYKSKVGIAYIGAGPELGLVYERSEYSYYTDSQSNGSYGSNQSSQSSGTKYDSREIRAGLSVVVGIKSYLTENIGLFAEAFFLGGKRWTKTDNYRYNYSDDTYFSISDESSDGNGWYYMTQWARIGVSIAI